CETAKTAACPCRPPSRRTNLSGSRSSGLRDLGAAPLRPGLALATRRVAHTRVGRA
nr:hypothetical protein [Tanacetum cinerariifolium]